MTGISLTMRPDPANTDPSPGAFLRQDESSAGPNAGGRGQSFATTPESEGALLDTAVDDVAPVVVVKLGSGGGDEVATEQAAKRTPVAPATSSECGLRKESTTRCTHDVPASRRARGGLNTQRP